MTLPMPPKPLPMPPTLTATGQTVLREVAAGMFGENSYMCRVGDRLRLDIHGEVSDLIFGNGPHRVCSFMGKDEARAVAMKLLEYANG